MESSAAANRKATLNSSNSSKKEKKKRTMILVEPTLVVEIGCCQRASSDTHHVIKSSNDHTDTKKTPEDSKKSSSKMRNNSTSTSTSTSTSNSKRLTSMLVILFGLVLLLTGSGSLGQSTNSFTSSLASGGNSTDLSNNLESPDEEPTASEGGLRSLIASTASEAVDKILVESPIRAAEEEESSAPAADEDSGEEEVTTAASHVSEAAGNSTEEARQLRDAFVVYRRWRATGDDIIELFARKVLPRVMEHSYELDPVSMANFLQIFNAIQGHKAWALKLLDSWAKLSPGLLVGTQSDFGDFDECLSVRVDNPAQLNEEDLGRAASELDPETGLRSTTVVGRYCVADVEFPKPPRARLGQRNAELQADFAPIELRRPLLNFSETAEFKDTIFVETANFFHMLYVDPIRVGICLTNKIEPDGFATILNKLLKDFAVSISFKGRCVTKYDRAAWSRQQVVSACVLLAACSLVLLSTLLDLLHMKLNKLPLPRRFDSWKLEARASMARHQPLFTSFSIIRNTKRLFKRQQQQQQPPSSSRTAMCSAAEMALCSTSTSLAATGSSSSGGESLESSPSIERRASGSVASSALQLIATSQEKEPTRLFAPAFTRAAAPTSATKEKLGRAENNLNCLHGIRVITMTWMIVNHTYLFGGFFVLWAHRRLIDIAEWPKSLSFQLVLNGWLTVETYFFLSAAIVVLNVMAQMRAKRFAYLAYILHRLIRLLPAYVGLVSLNFLWPLVSSGPVWLVKGRSFIQTPCENYLWTNFLFINNWIWPEKQCMVHTWFLSADFQLYLVAPIIVYLLYRRPVLGHSLNIIVALLASLLSGFVIYANKLMPSTLINKLEFDSIKQQLSYSYFATYQHMGPYCLGIFVGYLLHRRPQVQLPRHLTWCLWLLLPPLSFTTLLLTYLWNGAYADPSLINPSPLVSALYVAIHRTIWTSLLAWIVFACATGRAKLMSSFLSNPVFVPLSRLSFSIYLVHLPVIMFRALNLRHTIEWTDSNILWEACGNFVVSLIFGYFLNIFFESPIINLERVVFGRQRSDTAARAHAPAATVQQAGGVSRHASKTLAGVGSFTPKSSEDDDDGSDSSSSGHHQSPASRQVAGEYDLYAPSSSSSSSNAANAEHLATDRLGCISADIEQQMAASQRTSSLGEAVAPPGGNQLQATRQATSRQRLRRLSAATSWMDAGDLYPAAGLLPDRPYSHLLLSQQQQPPRPASAAGRPVQYATLARTSSRPERRDDDWPQLATSNRIHDSNYAYGAHKSRSHLDYDSSQHQQQRSMTSGSLSRQALAYSSQRTTTTGGGVHQRPARYNTLTPTTGGGRYLTRAEDSSWLAPGALLPRIDSSTLRRQSAAKQQDQQHQAASIAEESPPTSLEHN